MPVSEMDEIIPMYDALQVHRGEYSSGGADYSVTTLLDPPRVVHLNKRHINQVDLFIQDLYHSWSGTAAHNYLEFCLDKVRDKHGVKKYVCEQRNSMTIHSRLVSGAFDALWLEKLSLWDLKNTSTWKIMFGSKDDWAAQQNMYRLLYWNQHNVELKELWIIGIFRDWSKANKMRYGKGYPNTPVIKYGLPIWGMQETLDFMTVRVLELKAQEDVHDDDLPFCTFEDMWAKPDKVAVKADNRKNALRICDSMKDAETWIENYLNGATCKHKPEQLSFDIRRAERTRCEHWCSVNGYCNQYQNYIKTLGEK
jgi:hypothetical protein